MAYMNQAKKAEIAAELKRVIPKGWKYSLAVRHHSTIVLTIAAAPVDLIGQMQAPAEGHGNATYRTYASVNPYHWRRSGLDVAVWEPIFAALNNGNHDNSDLQSDYFDVGWYVDVDIGRWNKPFVNLAVGAQA